MNIHFDKYYIFNIEPQAAQDFVVAFGGSSAQGFEQISSTFDLTLLDGGEAHILVLPGEDVSLQIEGTLPSPGLSLKLFGAYICDGEQKVSLTTKVTHSAPECYSSQLFKGILRGNSRSAFQGRIVVAHGAEKTESYQENHNLLLSPTALATTQPELEIYADDVKCNHGATVGRLSEEEQFYMRSRGISLEEATRLQIISFLSPVLSGFPSDFIDRLYLQF